MEADRRSTKIPGPPAALKQLTASVRIFFLFVATPDARCTTADSVHLIGCHLCVYRKPMLPESAKLPVP